MRVDPKILKNGDLISDIEKKIYSYHRAILIFHNSNLKTDNQTQ